MEHFFPKFRKPTSLYLLVSIKNKFQTDNLKIEINSVKIILILKVAILRINRSSVKTIRKIMVTAFQITIMNCVNVYFIYWNTSNNIW